MLKHAGPLGHQPDTTLTQINTESMPGYIHLQKNN